MVLISEAFEKTGNSYDKFGDLVPSKVVKVLDPFYMDAYEVTVGQFKQFVQRSGYNYRGNWNGVAKYSPTDEHPMSYVTWDDAVAYAQWAGKRLPTEKEWEFAARGALIDKEFTWGDEESIAREYANFEGTLGKDQWDKTTAPVGSFRPNGYGLYDMAGNVYEWCQGWYSGEQVYRVLRGGSWNSNADGRRVSLRYSDDPADIDLGSGGFRCVSGSK